MNLYETDAEFMERFERFAFTEIVNENGIKLDDETRYMSILASLIGCQGVDAYKVIEPAIHWISEMFKCSELCQ